MGSQQQHHPFLPLSRQTSYYSLTLDEVESQLGLSGLGKPLGSMNLDELLKNVSPGEENNPSSALHHQPSLSKKTVDEVWRDIQLQAGGGGGVKDTHQTKPQERQPTLGEMTLEDFLVKAGIVSQTPDHNDKPIISTPQAQWLTYQLPSPQTQQPNMIYTHPVPPTTLMDTSFTENQMSISSPVMGALSDTQTPGRKRGASGGDMIQKTVERRQKRMIKNRESAARSRARKQAYTNELENKVSRLEEENARLKKEKEKEQLLPCAPPPPEPKYQLRRTSSACF